MITPKTQAAIAVLNDIYTGENGIRTVRYRLYDKEGSALLHQLTTAGLIQNIDKDNPQDIHSYAPTRKPADVSLLDILEATGEHLNCNHPITEEFYSKYGRAAVKLGVVNQITRTYLQEIRLSDLSA